MREATRTGACTGRRRPTSSIFLLPGYRGVVQVHLSTRTIKRIRWRIRELTRCNWGQSVSACMDRVNRYLAGWAAYFRLCTEQGAKLFRVLYAHIRRWIRCINPATAEASPLPVSPPAPPHSRPDALQLGAVRERVHGPREPLSCGVVVLFPALHGAGSATLQLARCAHPSPDKVHHSATTEASSFPVPPLASPPSLLAGCGPHCVPQCRSVEEEQPPSDDQGISQRVVSIALGVCLDPLEGTQPSCAGLRAVLATAREISAQRAGCVAHTSGSVRGAAGRPAVPTRHAVPYVGTEIEPEGTSSYPSRSVTGKM